MMALGLVSIMLLVGMIIRTKIIFIRKTLMPTSVVAGTLGLIILNSNLITSIHQDLYVEIVNILFTITFISIGLTNTEKPDSKSLGKTIAKGTLGLGFTWNILYAVTPVAGALILLIIGSHFDMSPLYGLLIPFAFTQGPGQASMFGTILAEEHGLANAAIVGMTFSAIGFLICFLVGIPLAKYGIKRGLANKMKGDDLEKTNYIERGFYIKEEQNQALGNDTMFSNNLDTMSFHFAIIGICFVMALGIASVLDMIPVIGPTISGMLFIHGMVAAFFVKFIMKKLHIEYMLDNTFQTKFTGWSTDYLIVASFMSIPLSIVGKWLIPIIVISVIAALITLLISIYFGQRLGAENDFERTLGLFGTATGTTPSGVALVRTVDPKLSTSTAIELGIMNLFMVPNFITISTIMAIVAGGFSLSTGLILLLIPIPVYLIIMKVFKAWGKKTYSLKSEASYTEENKKDFVN